jgi:hypothetical protein
VAAGRGSDLADVGGADERRPADHPISPSTITGMPKRGDLTCQHALFFRRWLDSYAGESSHAADARFRVDAPAGGGADKRLRWNLAALHDALNAQRQERALAWKQLARQLRGTESQLTGIKTAKYAIGMRLAMRIVVWLERPAAAFVYVAQW